MTTTPRPTADDLATARWVKSSYSSGGNECVALALAPGAPGWVGVRDTKQDGGPVLVLPRAALDALTGWATIR